MRITSMLQAAALGLAFVAASNAQATACLSGITCDKVSIELTSSQLANGTWQYDYTFSRIRYPYTGGAAPGAPVSMSAPLLSLQLPYFGDAGIANLKVGSNYAGLLTASIVDTPFGGAAQSILVALAPGQPVDVQQPDQVISGVNSLLSFTSTYAPDTVGPVRANVLNHSDWSPNDLSVLKLTSESVPYSSGYVSMLPASLIPGSPLAMAAAVPETGTWAMMGVGLLMLAGLGQRRKG
ncbi:MAG: hypothetical protein QM749_05400 [Aquabacterium sp.]